MIFIKRVFPLYLEFIVIKLGFTLRKCFDKYFFLFFDNVLVNLLYYLQLVLQS